MIAPFLLLLAGRGETAGGQHTTKATACQRSGSGSDPECRQTHRHPGAGARPGDHQPPMEFTKQAGTIQYVCSQEIHWCIKHIREELLRCLSVFMFMYDHLWASLYIQGISSTLLLNSTPSPLSSGGRADRPAPGGPVALWEIPRCSGASAKLAEWHRRAGGQSEASICRVPCGQGPDPRAKGTRRMQGHKIQSSFSCKITCDKKSLYIFRNSIETELRVVMLIAADVVFLRSSRVHLGSERCFSSRMSECSDFPFLGFEAVIMPPTSSSFFFEASCQLLSVNLSGFEFSLSIFLHFCLLKHYSEKQFLHSGMKKCVLLL